MKQRYGTGSWKDFFDYLDLILHRKGDKLIDGENYIILYHVIWYNTNVLIILYHIILLYWAMGV